MQRTRTLFAAVTIAAVTLLAACGDDTATDGAGADTTAAAADTAPADTSPADTTAPEGSTTGDTTGAPTGPGKDTEFCLYQQELNDMTTPFDDQNSGAAEFEQYFTETVNPAIDKLQATAPDEIKDEMTVLADGLRKFSTAFERNEWDPAKAYNDPDLQALATDEAYNKAGAAVDQYCGF